MFVLDFLRERFPTLSHQEIERRMQNGDVLDAAGKPMPANAPYRAQDTLYYYRFVPDEPVVPFEATVLFQDEFLVAVDKPHFLTATPVGRYVQETLLVRLKRQLGIDTLAPMHRLDRETAGVMLFTLQPETRGAYQALFAMRTVAKSYEAVVTMQRAHPFPLEHASRLVADTHFMRMCEAEGASNAVTRIECIERNAHYARLALFPRTGKKHQLRVHLAALGMPILNDAIYPRFAEGHDDFSRPLQLLAKHISFRDPITGQPREFQSQRTLGPLPTF